MTALSTKEKILATANHLFAKFGYDGTSVRDIAKEAGVNLAAINYHFKNKENLYCEIYATNHQELEKEIDALDDGKIATADFAWKLFQLFIEKDQSFLNIFKIILTNNVQIPENYKLQGNVFGPPGQNTFLKIITRDTGEKVTLEGRIWAVRVIFMHVSHAALMLSTSIIKDLCDKSNAYPEEAKKRNIQYLSDAVIEQLIQHPEKWK